VKTVPSMSSSSDAVSESSRVAQSPISPAPTRTAAALALALGALAVGDGAGVTDAMGDTEGETVAAAAELGVAWARPTSLRVQIDEIPSSRTNVATNTMMPSARCLESTPGLPSLPVMRPQPTGYPQRASRHPSAQIR
jgi:hypothetical protein